MFKELCDEKCVNLSKMAEKIGIPYSTVMGHYNGGKIPFESARKYSEFFNVPLSSVQAGFPNLYSSALIDVGPEKVVIE